MGRHVEMTLVTGVEADARLRLDVHPADSGWLTRDREVANIRPRWSLAILHLGQDQLKTIAGSEKQHREERLPVHMRGGLQLARRLAGYCRNEYFETTFIASCKAIRPR